MVMIVLLFLVALSLSTTAGVYGVMGLIAIFPTAPVKIGILGLILEASKLVIASWLYRNWKDIPALLKTYFLIAITVLMGLTSLGIYGGLSKAHLDQAVPAGDILAKLELVDSKIKIEKEIIDESRKSLNQLDSAVDQTLARSTDTNGATKSANLRRSQSAERKALNQQIQDSTSKIQALNEERAPLATETRKIEAEVGPIKYIAAIIYGDSPDANLLEKAVRFVILLIVIVFDPLAVLMLVAANWQLKADKERANPTISVVTPIKPPEPIVEPVKEDPKPVKPPKEPTAPPIPEESQEIIDSFFNKPTRKKAVNHKLELKDETSLTDDLALEPTPSLGKLKTRRSLM